MTCSLCAGKGFVWLRSRETHATHVGTGERLVHRIVQFRAPCECEAGDRWLSERARAPSKK